MNQRNPVTLRDGVNHEVIVPHLLNMNQAQSETQILAVNQNRGEIHSPNMNHPVCENHFPCMSHL